MTAPQFDIAIIGAGIAGASLAWELSRLAGERLRIALVEMESRPGYHTTGRSAAFWVESYGGPGVVPL
jgi:D-arginine dehydrogenase